jgi:hypothetical protein
VNRLGIYALTGALFFSLSMKDQRITDKTLDITVQVLDGRNGKPLADQHVLVFTGLSSDAVKTHAQHTGLTTDKDGMGTLTIYPGETQWLRSSRTVVSLASQTLTKPALASATSSPKGWSRRTNVVLRSVRLAPVTSSSSPVQLTSWKK